MSHAHKYPRPSDEVVANAVDRLDAGLRELFEERAGVREHDGLLDRPLAEALALLDVLVQSPAAPSKRNSGLIVIQVELDGSTEWVLTGDLDHARQHLANLGGKEVAVLDPADVVREQFGDVAVLAVLG